MSDSCRTHCHGDHATTIAGHRVRGGLDTVAAVLSSLCLLHCIAIPVAIALLPAFALVIPDLPWLHAGLLVVAVPASGLALWRGWRIHHDRVPAAVGAVGLVVMGSALLTVAHSLTEVSLTVGGGLLVAGGHLLNLRAGARDRAR
ncbi:MerC domain-containing protein [Sphingomonas montana]|uniref:MerC domain-containing protein n=1 Tax=Sphingomonas montana TaxID=1843236 RepID=UPI0009F87991|nr:MerC domain-containing protein [Sphingomonas montana]